LRPPGIGIETTASELVSKTTKLVGSNGWVGGRAKANRREDGVIGESVNELRSNLSFHAILTLLQLSAS
jgi:hypothetical protein